MEIQKLKVGDIVRVTRPQTATPAKRRRTDEGLDTAPTIGRIVWVHPRHIFYVVEFRDKYTAAYKPIYRESFYPERLEKIHQPNFMSSCQAHKLPWAK